jgi:hypothetical protein
MTLRRQAFRSYPTLLHSHHATVAPNNSYAYHFLALVVACLMWTASCMAKRAEVILLNLVVHHQGMCTQAS